MAGQGRWVRRRSSFALVERVRDGRKEERLEPETSPPPPLPPPERRERAAARNPAGNESLSSPIIGAKLSCCHFLLETLDIPTEGKTTSENSQFSLE